MRITPAALLFDMDGTLSPARKPVIREFVELLPKLTDNYNVGIVTGSGLEYVKEQASFLFEGSLEDFGPIHIMPCNGTKYFISKPPLEKVKITTFGLILLGKRWFLLAVPLVICMYKKPLLISFNFKRWLIIIFNEFWLVNGLLIFKSINDLLNLFKCLLKFNSFPFRKPITS